MGWLVGANHHRHQLTPPCGTGLSLAGCLGSVDDRARWCPSQQGIRYFVTNWTKPFAPTMKVPW